MAISIGHLSRHLNVRTRKGSMKLTSDDTKEIEETHHWKGREIPWNKMTCLAVVCYVAKFLSVTENTCTLSDTVRRLNDLASELATLSWKFVTDNSTQNKWRDPMHKTRLQIAEIFVNSFMKEVRKFFTVPKMQQLIIKDKSLKKNECLVGFMDFLLQILSSESLVDEREEQKYTILRKELTFLLTILGDVPFQCTELEEFGNILAEYETLANEAGGFIYSCVFSTRPVKISIFISGKHALLEKVELLNAKIKEHCIKFAEIPESVRYPRSSAVYSFFIVDSLLEDLDNLMSRQSDLIIDGVKDQIKTFHKELLFTRTRLRDVQFLQAADMDGQRESSGQIIDVVYEAEYLINSHVVGNLPIWYLNLRLPFIIQKVKISTALHESSKIRDGKVLQVTKDSYKEVPSRATETPMIAVDNIVEGFEDNKTKILGDLTGGSSYGKIISVVGMPGLGKTTIAKKLYEDRLISDYFDEQGWCVVSQSYQKRKVLIEILTSFRNKPKKNSILKLNDGSLGLEIHKSIKGRIYLIVMDDVWHPNIWDDLMRYFPDDVNGSRIMLTSRIKDTAPTNSLF